MEWSVLEKGGNALLLRRESLTRSASHPFSATLLTYGFFLNISASTARLMVPTSMPNYSASVRRSLCSS
jgi:hypothetical protein